MRLVLIVALLLPAGVLPAGAAAQIDLTATPKSVGHTLRILQQHIGPGMHGETALIGWCIADAYRLVAEQTADVRIESATRRAATRYEAIATRQLERTPGGLAVPKGTEVTVRVTDRAVCRTRARVSAPTRG
ncbi:hypothetical protein [Rubrivirga sp. IMCC45206]|uniref:hypothetical protein n=1 Tax=Rubrivirga sp. IMCC45206 TaxID=3391614 RepID=UPI00398F9B55